MTALMWLSISLAVTLPTALSALLTIRLADPMLKRARSRNALRSAAIVLVFLSMATPTLWKQLQPKLAMSAQVPEASSQARRLAPTRPYATRSADVHMFFSAIVLVWAIGASLKLAATGIGLARSYRDIATSDLLNDQRLCAAVRDQAAELGLPTPRLVVSRKAGSAVLVGFFDRTIVLPVALVGSQSVQSLTWVCRHELCHLRRGDNWRVLGDRLALSILWFNPFATALVRSQVQVREELCDEAALQGAGDEQRRLYASSLIAALRASGGPNLLPSFGHRKGGDHMMRLKAILHPPGREPRSAAIMAASLLVLVGGAGLSSGAALAAIAPSTTVEKSSLFESSYTSDAPLGRDRGVRPPRTSTTSRNSLAINSDNVTVHDRTSVYTGSPNIRIDGDFSHVALMVNGQHSTVEAVNAVPKGKIERIEVTRESVTPSTMQKLSIFTR